MHPRAGGRYAVFVGGFAGSGKSQLGRMMARAAGWPVLDKDTLSRPVVEAALELAGQSPDDRESETYLKVLRPAEYAALVSAVTENLKCGASAIATAPFLREFADRAWLDRVTVSCADLSAKAVFVWVYCDERSMQTYLRQRGAARDTWKLANWARYLDSIDLSFRPPVPHRVVDNSLDAAPLQSQAAELVQTLT
jgi:predicted kinase